jgi:hypothetical protein
VAVTRAHCATVSRASLTMYSICSINLPCNGNTSHRTVYGVYYWVFLRTLLYIIIVVVVISPVSRCVTRHHFYARPDDRSINSCPICSISSNSHYYYVTDVDMWFRVSEIVVNRISTHARTCTKWMRWKRETYFAPTRREMYIEYRTRGHRSRGTNKFVTIISFSSSARFSVNIYNNTRNNNVLSRSLYYNEIHKFKIQHNVIIMFMLHFFIFIS